MKSLTKKNTLATTSSDSGFKTSVKANSPVFKIIKSNTWYIAAYISEDYTKDWKTGNVVNIYAKDDNGVSYTLPATINTLSTVKDGKEKYVILSNYKKYAWNLLGTEVLALKLKNQRRDIKFLTVLL